MAHKKSARKKKITKRDASDVTRFFYLNDISLWESSLRRDGEFRWGDASENYTTQAFKAIEPELLEVEVQGQEEQQIMLRVLVRLGVRAVIKNDEEKDPEPIYTLEATFCADYFILTPPSQETFRDFVEFNCIHNVWPFWRQHVFNTLKQASLPVPTVPLYAGQSKYRKKNVNVSRVLAAAKTSDSEKQIEEATSK